MGEKYLVNGAILKCDKGSAPSPLMVPGHNIEITGQQMANKTDCAVGTNILPLGVCSITGKPCEPAIVGQWFAPNAKQTVGGEASITTGSFLVCALGALIEPTTCGQGMVGPQMQSLTRLMDALLALNEKVNPNTGPEDWEFPELTEEFKEYLEEYIGSKDISNVSLDTINGKVNYFCSKNGINKSEWEKLQWDMGKVERLWEKCRTASEENKMVVDPRMMLAIISVEGTGSFDTKDPEVKGNNYNGAVYNADFDADFAAAMKIVSGKLKGYSVYGEDFDKATRLMCSYIEEYKGYKLKGEYLQNDQGIKKFNGGGI